MLTAVMEPAVSEFVKQRQSCTNNDGCPAGDVCCNDKCCDGFNCSKKGESGTCSPAIAHRTGRRAAD